MPPPGKWWGGNGKGGTAIYYTKESIEQARKVDLLTYLRQCDPQELVHVSGNVYCTKTHDSLRISNGKWCWFSRGIGGASALDYLIKVNGYSFLEAMETISGRAAERPPISMPTAEKPQPKTLLLPERSPTSDRVIAYLTGRGIDREILDYCIQTGRLYESLPHHNAVFLGFDNQGKARFGCQRGTGKARFHGDLNGSDKRFGFCLTGDSPSLHLFEAPIDALSYATLCKMKGINWREQNLLSLAGVYRPSQKGPPRLPLALEQFLKDHPGVNRVCLHLDNDLPGKQAAQAILSALPENVQGENRWPPFGKEVNDSLCHRRGFARRQSLKGWER